MMIRGCSSPFSPPPERTLKRIPPPTLPVTFSILTPAILPVTICERSWYELTTVNLSAERRDTAFSATDFARSDAIPVTTISSARNTSSVISNFKFEKSSPGFNVKDWVL